MKKIVVLAFVTGILAGAQEISSVQPVATQIAVRIPVANQGFQGSYVPANMKIVGSLNYGEISGPVLYSATPRFRAFVFNGHGGDVLQITVKSADRKAVVAVADSTLNQVATGISPLKVTLPSHGPDLEAWYVIFREPNGRPARFTVQVKKTGTDPDLAVPSTR